MAVHARAARGDGKDLMTKGELKFSYPQSVVDDMARRGKGIGSLRETQAERQFADMRPTIDRWSRDLAIRSVLDIGCGLALIDIMIARHYLVDEVHLIDGDGSSQKGVGYDPDAVAWNDVRLGADMVRANVPDDDVIVTPHFAPGDWPRMGKFDLVISCRSWCHHYPAATYARQVAASLTPGGLVITDIRRKTNGLQTMLDAGFRVLERVPDPSDKLERLAFVKA